MAVTLVGRIGWGGGLGEHHEKRIVALRTPQAFCRKLGHRKRVVGYSLGTEKGADDRGMNRDGRCDLETQGMKKIPKKVASAK